VSGVMQVTSVRDLQVPSVRDLQVTSVRDLQVTSVRDLQVPSGVRSDAGNQCQGSAGTLRCQE